MFSSAAQIIAVTVLIVSYLILFTEKLNRAVTVLLGTAVLIFGGILSQEAAIRAVDFNTLALLSGMMIIVGIAEKSGMFQYLAIAASKLVRASPRGILADACCHVFCSNGLWRRPYLFQHHHCRRYCFKGLAFKAQFVVGAAYFICRYFRDFNH